MGAGGGAKKCLFPSRAAQRRYLSRPGEGNVSP
jgi:hypothetical protein